MGYQDTFLPFAVLLPPSNGPKESGLLNDARFTFGSAFAGLCRLMFAGGGVPLLISGGDGTHSVMCNDCDDLLGGLLCHFSIPSDSCGTGFVLSHIKLLLKISCLF